MHCVLLTIVNQHYIWPYYHQYYISKEYVKNRIREIKPAFPETWGMKPYENEDQMYDIIMMKKIL